MTPQLPVYWDELFVEHESPGGGWALPPTELNTVDQAHPERPGRVRNIKGAIEEKLSEYATWESVTPSSWDQIKSVHDPEFVDEIRHFFCEEGGGRVLHDGEPGFTGGNEATCEAMPMAAGAAIQTAERALADGIEEVPYAPVRPIGHHAMSDEVDGFCIFNNVAIAAEHVLSQGMVDRVAILDWDVHHGNGTQEIFYDRDDVLFASLHYNHGRWAPWHPQTGQPEEKGEGEGEGYNINIPLPHGTGNVGYAHAFENLIEPVVADFDPDLVLVSNGLDPGKCDPLARQVVTKPGFKEMGRRTRRLAADYADGSLGVIQEGGYMVSHLPYTVLGVLEGVLDVDTGVDDPFDWEETQSENLDLAIKWIRQARRVHAEQWPVTELGRGK